MKLLQIAVLCLLMASAAESARAASVSLSFGPVDVPGSYFAFPVSGSFTINTPNLSPQGNGTASGFLLDYLFDIDGSYIYPNKPDTFSNYAYASITFQNYSPTSWGIEAESQGLEFNLLFFIGVTTNSILDAYSSWDFGTAYLTSSPWRVDAVTPVPMPGALPLLATALLLIGGLARFQRSKPRA